MHKFIRIDSEKETRKKTKPENRTDVSQVENSEKNKWINM